MCSTPGDGPYPSTSGQADDEVELVGDDAGNGRLCAGMSCPPMKRPGTTSFHGSSHSGMRVALPVPSHVTLSGIAAGSA